MGILYITRHGETGYNRLNLLMGRRDVEINENGLAQAHELGRRLQEMDVDFIISSPLVRAKKTAEIVSQCIHKELKLDDRLTERSVGVYEGLTKKEVKEKQFQRGYGNDMDKIYNEIPLSGESANDVQKRVFAMLNELEKNYPDKKILIVTHAFIARMINKYFNPNISAEEFFNFELKSTEIKKFDF